MKKNKAIAYLTVSIIGVATIRSILKYKTDRQKEFTDYVLNILEADKDDVFEFLISLPDDEFSFIVSVYDRLSRSLSLENEIREAVESPHAPGNRTRN